MTGHLAATVAAPVVSAHQAARGVPIALGYRPELDGIRGIAVLAVLIFHSGLIVGGWLGVDVFFALSGFLITTLLVDEHARTGTIRLRYFYLRRALRLLPALLTLVAVLVVVLLATVSREQRIYLVLYVVAVLFYVANWVEPLGIPLGWGFGHTWSLGIEEQFYLLWPLVLLVLLRLKSRRVVTVVVTIAAVAAVAYRITLLHYGVGHIRLSEGTDTHADPLLIGCTLAFLISWGALPVRRMPRQVVHGLGIGGLLVLVILLVHARYPIYYVQWNASTMAAVCTTFIIASLWLPGSPIRPLFRSRLLVGTGRVSYGLYLWHYPIFFALGVNTYGAQAPALTIIAAWVAAVAATLVCFYGIERPALRLKARFVVAGGSRAAVV